MNKIEFYISERFDAPRVYEVCREEVDKDGYSVEHSIQTLSRFNSLDQAKNFLKEVISSAG